MSSQEIILFFLLAVYLCKRTMQNKARLELADYEAVSTKDAHTVVKKNPAQIKPLAISGFSVPSYMDES